jgi:hypothetical protein
VALLFAFAGLRGATPIEARALPHPRAYRHARRLALWAQVGLAAASLLLVLRGGAFALRRPGALAGDRLVAPFGALSDAVDYVDRLHCAQSPGELVPPEILGDPASADGLRRFHHAFQRAYARERATGVALARRFADGGACGPGSGAWTAEPMDDECRLTFKFGWPEVHLAIARAGAGASAQCTASARPEPLLALRRPQHTPDGERIRLLSRARGEAAGDQGELIAGSVVVRLRPAPATAPRAAFAAANAAPGLYFAAEIALSDDLSLVARDRVVHLVRRSAPHAHDPAWLVVRQAPAERVAEADEGGWSMHAVEGQDTVLPTSGASLIVTGGTRGRTVWLYRPSADPLLADDVATATGHRFRHYIYGGLVPELGWVNPYAASLSLGLDGWVRVAAHEHAARVLPKSAPEPAPTCGTLKPVPDDYGAVCAPSPLDGVLECRVTLQPELEIRMRHLLELASQAPELFPRGKSGRVGRPAQRAEAALLAGDSGEILARAEFVPGRESTAYAPRTPEIEQHLIRLREGRAPRTGKKLANASEPDALKADLGQRIAIGSTLKPLFAHALERAEPVLAERLVLSAPPDNATGECPGGWLALLGHCPPTRSIWDEGQSAADYPRYLAQSLNWYQAAVGLIGTAAGGGSFGFGAAGPAQSTAELSSLSLALPRAQALWTKSPSGRSVLSANSVVDLDALRETPLWRELEAIVGRPLCTEPSARACQRKSERGDLCATRGLPIDKPSRDLRHLVALGPSDFDFLPERTGSRVPVSEYYQFLRGSGVHELGSLLQLADAFNRLFYERTPQPGGGYRLAASWFPTHAVGSPPPWACPDGAPTAVARGLCDVIAAPHGTAHALEPLLHEGDLVVYGAKTGTIDALRDLAEHKKSCDSWNRAHAVAGGKSAYQLPCGKGGGADINDSLFVIAFGVKSGDKVVPLLMALRFQGVGQGYATGAARPFIDLVREYFARPRDGAAMAAQR